MKDELVQEVFPAIAEMLKDPTVLAVLTIDQKRRILEALDMTIEEISETHVRMGVLYVILDIDVANPNDPKVKVELDITSFLKEST